MIALIASLSLMNLLIRFLPFVFAERLRGLKWFHRLNTQLPAAIVLLLVLHTLKDRPYFTHPYGIPEFVGIVAVVAVQLLWKRAVVSMGIGVAVYCTLLAIMGG